MEIPPDTTPTDTDLIAALDGLLRVYDGRQDPCVHLTPGQLQRVMHWAKEGRRLSRAKALDALAAHTQATEGYC